MKRKVSDYIADTIADGGVRDVFTVTGGGAMHLNDSFGHHGRLRCTYHHHEQASAMAAEAYARIDNRMAAVCVTSGPGHPMRSRGAVCLDGFDTDAGAFGSGAVCDDGEKHGLACRVLWVQEYDIVPSVAPMTKYAVMVTDAKDIRYHLERAMYLAVNGRPGPVWLDLPLDAGELWWRRMNCGDMIRWRMPGAG